MAMLNLKIIDVSEVSVSQCHLSGLCCTWVGSWWFFHVVAALIALWELWTS